MFKKKPNIPPRPKPPVTDQVLDDLQNAPENDVVFLLMNTSPSDSSRGTSSFNLTGDVPAPQNSDDIRNPEVVYQKVRSFLEVTNNLQSMIQKLSVQNEALITSDAELKKMADDIRRQAIDALK